MGEPRMRNVAWTDVGDHMPGVMLASVTSWDEDDEPLFTQLNQLHEIARFQISHGLWHPSVSPFRHNVGEYPVARWDSKAALANYHRLCKRGKQMPLSVCHLPYRDRHWCDPFKFIGLPVPVPGRFLVVYRLVVMPDTPPPLHANALYLVPTDGPTPPRQMTGLSDRLHVTSDETVERYAKGLCGACGTSAKLKTCSGCGLVGFCSKACQQQSWKTHKKLCRAVAKSKAANAAHAVE